MTLVLALSCAQTVSRDDWQRMSTNEKTLYVKSLIGAEVARARKGGAQASGKNPEDVIEDIDSAYARGDQRSPEEIFNTLAARRDAPQPPRPASRADG